MNEKTIRIKIHKTPVNQRTTYTYISADGTKTVLRPGENDITEAHIKMLHAMDDAEVYNNIKNGRPEPTETEKQQMREWEETHQGEKAPHSWKKQRNIIILPSWWNRDWIFLLMFLTDSAQVTVSSLPMKY